MLIRSLFYLFCIGFLFLSDSSLNATSCNCDVNCCGALTTSKCKLKKGFIHLPARTQAFFVGDPVCRNQQENVPEADIFVRVKGKRRTTRPTVVFVHGFGETGDVWGCAQEELSDCYLTVAMDLRGFGRSSKTPAVPDLNGIHYTVDLNVQDIFLVLEKLGITRNIVIVGHSNGANYAFKYTSLHQEQIFKLVMINGPVLITPDCAADPYCSENCFNEFNCQQGYCWPFGLPFTKAVDLTLPLDLCLIEGGNEKECLKQWGQFIAPLWYNEPCQNKLKDAQQALVNSVVSNTQAIIKSIAFGANTEDLRYFIPTVTVPTLICIGSIDIIVNPETGRFYHANMPNSVLAEFVGKGHQMHVTDFKNFDRLLKKFIPACEFPDFTKVYDEGCCVCPNLIPPTPVCECSR